MLVYVVLKIIRNFINEEIKVKRGKRTKQKNLAQGRLSPTTGLLLPHTHTLPGAVGII